MTTEAEHAAAEREQHVRARLRAGRRAAVRGRERVGPDAVEEYLSKFPTGLTPSVETPELPKGGLSESCAVMMYLANREGLDDLYPTDLGAARDGRRRELLHDEHALPARRAGDLPAPRLRRLSGRGLDLGRVRRGQGSGPRRRPRTRPPAPPRGLSAGSSSATAGFIGGDSPTIADIRLACTLEFLAVADTELPDWAKDYMQRVESALGDAYSEPAGDVRGYIAQVTGEAVAT